MYGYDTYRGACMTSCPICYCMVEEKFMSLHVMWHEDNDPKEEGYIEENYSSGYQRTDKFKYDL
jgi:hypothetical protein